VFCRTPYGFSQSPYLQGKIALVAQACVFEEGEEIFRELTGVEVNAKQIERIGHGYGELLETRAAKQADELKQKEEGLYYGMMDGGMVLTREDDWKDEIGPFV
jgi:hypothetical protein